MKRKFLIILLLFFFPLVSCKGRGEFDEIDKAIEQKLKSMDKDTAELLEKIFTADTREALYYDDYREDGNIVSSGMDVYWDDKKISYSNNNLHDIINPIEEAVLFEGRDVLVINITKGKFYRKRIAEGIDRYVSSKRKYPDLSNIYDSLLDNDIKNIEQRDDFIKINFSDDSYKIFDKDYVMIESKFTSEKKWIKRVLRERRSDLENIFAEFKGMTETMEEVESREDFKK